MSTIHILVAGDAGIDNLVATARKIGGETVAVVAGTREVADAVAASGVDRVQWLGDPAGRPLEAFAPAAAEIVAAAGPDYVLVASRSAERALVGAVAATLAAPVYTMVSDIEDGAITRALFGGIAQETVKVPGTAILVMEGGSPATGGSAPVEEVSGTVLDAVTVVESRAAEYQQVDLGKASRIVAIGRGLKAQEDVAMIEALAAALGAEVACSRPLAEGQEWFTHDRYIGVTGQHVAPELYVAIGISGQLQHTVGARGAGTVVVVNTDKDCPYMAETDYGIVGDLYTVVPALTEALQ